jgi:hypothetical protein
VARLFLLGDISIREGQRTTGQTGISNPDKLGLDCLDAGQHGLPFRIIF